MKHFETATLGAKSARALLDLEAQHGPLRDVVGGFLNDYAGTRENTWQRPALFALFADGHRALLDSYTGDTPERIRAIARLKWVEAVDWPATLARIEAGLPEMGADRTGACVEVGARLAA